MVLLHINITTQSLFSLTIRLDVHLADYGAGHPRVWEEIQRFWWGEAGPHPAVRAAQGRHERHHRVGYVLHPRGWAQDLQHHPGRHRRRRGQSFLGVHSGNWEEEEGSKKEGEKIVHTVALRTGSVIVSHCDLVVAVASEPPGWQRATRGRGNAEGVGARQSERQSCDDASGETKIKFYNFWVCFAPLLWPNITTFSFDSNDRSPESRISTVSCLTWNQNTRKKEKVEKQKEQRSETLQIKWT